MAVVTYKCPHCDAGLTFDPASGSFHCEYCGGNFSEEELAALQPDSEEERKDETGGAFVQEGDSAQSRDTDHPFFTQEPEDDEQAAQRHEQAAAGAVIYSCPSCGAQIVTDETTAATYCYYCHNPVVLAGKLSGEFAPDMVVPFAIDRDKAVAEFLNWTRKCKFIPRAFFNKKQIEKLTGVYMPYWAANCELDGGMTMNGTRSSSHRSGNIEHIETRHYKLVREGEFSFQDMTFNALKTADSKFTSEIQPFDLSQAKEFSMPYLQGFQAQKRDLDKKDVQPVLEQDVRKYTEDMLKLSASEYILSNVQSHMQLKRTDYRYVLLPVWMLTYQGHDKKHYYYAMNGQTGKVCGKLPVDYGKLGGLFAAIAGTLFLLLTLWGYLL